MTRPRVVVIAPMVPIDAPPHAGGHYLQSVVRFAESVGPTTVIVPDGPINRATASAEGVPKVLFIVRHRASTLTGKALNRMVAIADANLRWVDPALANLPMAHGLLRRGPAREALREAEVIDLQWSESVRLARLIGHLNPHARVVGTFHDVQSQLFSREPAGSAVERVRRRVATRLSRWHERRDVEALDEVAVFSDKDARLLGEAPHLRVIRPPLASGDETMPPRRSGPPTIVFVAHFMRPVNDDAALWFLREVWPTVQRAAPGVRLRLIGAGPSDALLAAVDRSRSVTLTGFVDDLGAEYRRASLAVVPLRRGAGVKFKTIEALLQGVPVVTTPVGAEGVEGPDLFAVVEPEAAAFAAAVIGTLSHLDHARERAREAMSWAVHHYSQAAFEAGVAEHYALDRTALRRDADPHER